MVHNRVEGVHFSNFPQEHSLGGEHDRRPEKQESLQPKPTSSGAPGNRSSDPREQGCSIYVPLLQPGNRSSDPRERGGSFFDLDEYLEHLHQKDQDGGLFLPTEKLAEELDIAMTYAVQNGHTNVPDGHEFGQFVSKSKNP